MFAPDKRGDTVNSGSEYKTRTFRYLSYLIISRKQVLNAYVSATSSFSTCNTWNLIFCLYLAVVQSSKEGVEFQSKGIFHVVQTRRTCAIFLLDFFHTVLWLALGHVDVCILTFHLCNEKPRAAYSMLKHDMNDASFPKVIHLPFPGLFAVTLTVFPSMQLEIFQHINLMRGL